MPLVTVLTKSGCIPDINAYDGSRSRKSIRTDTATSLSHILSQLNLDLDNELFGNENAGTPRLASLNGGTPKLSNLSARTSDESMDVYTLNALMPALSGSPSVLEHIAEMHDIDTEPYAI